jgi:predicted nuclease with TOPRIM domain
VVTVFIVILYAVLVKMNTVEHNLTPSLDKLTQRLERSRQDRGEMQERIKDLEREKADLTARLKELEGENSKLKTALAIGVGGGDKVKARERIAELVREVDMCIKLLGTQTKTE